MSSPNNDFYYFNPVNWFSNQENSPIGQVAAATSNLQSYASAQVAKSMPKPPTGGEAQVAKNMEKNRAKKYGGLASTILTSPLGTTDQAVTTKKTLFGQ